MAAAARNQAEPLPVAPLAQRWNLNVVLVWLFCAYLLLVPIADLMLYSASRLAAGNELTRDRSRFAVVNALTLTGFQLGTSIDTYPVPGQVLLFLLTLGGAAFTMVAGGLAVVRIVRLPYSDADVVRGSLIVLAVSTLGAGVLLLDSSQTGATGLLRAGTLAASAIGNSGLLFGDPPVATSWQVQVLLLPLAVVGGLGIPVLLEVYRSIIRRQPLSPYAWTVLGMTGALYLIGLLIVLAVRWATPGDLPPAAEFLATSSAVSLNSRTLGLPFEYAQDYPRAMRWALMLLMIVGGSPAGTAGGLHTTTLVELIRGSRRTLAGAAPGRSFAMACIWTAAYFAIAAAVFFTLMLTDPQVPSERLLFESISAVSNVGLSVDRIYIVMPGLDALTTGMLFGRLAPLLILWWMAQTTTDAQLPVG